MTAAISMPVNDLAGSYNLIASLEDVVKYPRLFTNAMQEKGGGGRWGRRPSMMAEQMADMSPEIGM